MDDTNILMGDCGIDITLGDKSYRVKALTVGKSIEWSKQVQSIRIKAAMKQLEFVQAAKKAQTEQDVDALIQSGTTVSFDIEALMKFVELHSPELKKPIQQATTRQIIAAYEAIKELENPTDLMIKAFR